MSHFWPLFPSFFAFFSERLHCYSTASCRVWFIELEKLNTNVRFDCIHSKTKSSSVSCQKMKQWCETVRNLSTMALHYCNTHYDSHEGHMPPFMLVLVWVGAVVWPGADVSIGLILRAWLIVWVKVRIIKISVLADLSAPIHTAEE